MADETDDRWPERGTYTIDWESSMLDGSRRLGWQASADPPLPPDLAIALLRDVADELEIDLPE